MTDQPARNHRKAAFHVQKFNNIPDRGAQVMAKAWYKHFPSDWQSDPRLNQCSRAARSLWLDCVGLMQQEGTWRLEIDGRPMTTKELAKAFGDNPRTTKKLMNELAKNGVSSVSQQLFTYSRRLKRDAKTTEMSILNGRKGGNPALLKRKTEDLGVNPGVKSRARVPEPEPEKEKKKEKTSKKKTGSRLADDWTLPDDYWRWALEQGLTDDQVRLEADVFRDYWCGLAPGPKSRKLDWLATWRNHIRRDMNNRNKKNGNGNSKSADRQSAFVNGGKDNAPSALDQGQDLDPFVALLPRR